MVHFRCVRMGGSIFAKVSDIKFCPSRRYEFHFYLKISLGCVECIESVPKFPKEFKTNIEAETNQWNWGVNFYDFAPHKLFFYNFAPHKRCLHCFESI